MKEKFILSILDVIGTKYRVHNKDVQMTRVHNKRTQHNESSMERGSEPRSDAHK